MIDRACCRHPPKQSRDRGQTPTECSHHCRSTSTGPINPLFFLFLFLFFLPRVASYTIKGMFV